MTRRHEKREAIDIGVSAMKRSFGNIICSTDERCDPHSTLPLSEHHKKAHRWGQQRRWRAEATFDRGPTTYMTQQKSVPCRGGFGASTRRRLHDCDRTAAAPERFTAPDFAQLQWQMHQSSCFVHYNMATMVGTQGFQSGFAAPLHFPTRPRESPHPLWIIGRHGRARRYSRSVAGVTRCRRCSPTAARPRSVCGCRRLPALSYTSSSSSVCQLAPWLSTWLDSQTYRLRQWPCE